MQVERPLSQVQNTPNYTGILPSAPFLFTIEVKHLQKANVR
jgi:hypothetical protein